MSVVRGHIASFEYSTDYTGDYDTATWTSVPIIQLLQEGLQIPSEEAQLVQTMNGLDVSAGKKAVAAIPVAKDDADTFLTAIKTTDDELSPVWFAIKPTGQDRRIIGGDNGCAAYVNEDAMPAWGSLKIAMIGFSATGPQAGDTFRVVSAGS